MSSSRNSFDASSVASVPSPTAPKFPTVSELVEFLQTGKTTNPLVGMVAAPPDRVPGLFSELLRDNIETLAQDVLAYPDRYDPQTRELVLDIVTRRPSSLTTEERLRLDQATLDFATTTAPRPTSKPRQSAPRAPSREPVFTDGPEPGVDTPEGVVAPYWWV